MPEILALILISYVLYSLARATLNLVRGLGLYDDRCGHRLPVIRRRTSSHPVPVELPLSSASSRLSISARSQSGSGSSSASLSSESQISSISRSFSVTGSLRISPG